MHDDRATLSDATDPEEGLIDLTGLDLTDLDTADRSCLAQGTSPLPRHAGPWHRGRRRVPGLSRSGRDEPT